MLMRCTKFLCSTVPRWALARRCVDGSVWGGRGYQSRVCTPAQFVNSNLSLRRTNIVPRCSLSIVTASSVTQQRQKLFLYSKEGCHLCDGLKEKIQALLERAQFMPSPLTHVDFEIRDITTEPAWWDAYLLTIPVLTFADADGSNEVKVPRPSPRISTDRLGQHLEKALSSR